MSEQKGRKFPRESEMSIESAILIATRAHRGQVDLGGSPYILHPLRVMLEFASPNYFDTAPYHPIDYMLAAMLHDVVEDSEWTLEQLHEARVSDSALEAIDHLTRRKAEGEGYSAYIARVNQNEIARLVKLEDLDDNLKIARLRPSQFHRYAGLLERDYRAGLLLSGVKSATQMAAARLEEKARARRNRESA